MQHEHIYNFLKLIPDGKVISTKQLADIFCTSINDVVTTIGNKSNVVVQPNKKDSIWNPVLTNYYISLIAKDTNAISYFENISHKITLLHPNCIVKIPTNYHITLADLSNTPVNKKLIDTVFLETIGLPPFLFQCTLHKPYIDKKKNKVIFWVRIEENPFLLTLHQCIKKYVPRRSDKQFIPHVTLGKILGTTDYNEKMNIYSINTTCDFSNICICANIDHHKQVILFNKEIK